MRGVSKTSICYSLFFLLFIFFFCLTAQETGAQAFLGGTSGIELTIDPRFPAPNTPTLISLDDYSVNTAGATISWFIDGIEQKNSENERSLSLTTKNLGEETRVEVTLRRSNAPSFSSSVKIVPSVVDIIIEADTYVPHFYKGRALPSEESRLKAIAVVHDGTEASQALYTYKWSYGGSVLEGGGVRGKNIATFILSRYDNKPLILEIFNDEGDMVGEKFITLRTTAPELLFYEESPLRGLSLKTIASPFPFIGEEVTIYGEPYFINADMDESDATFSWTINGTDVSSSVGIPNALTLERTGDSGGASIGFSILTKTKIPQFLEQTFQTFFQ